MSLSDVEDLIDARELRERMNSSHNSINERPPSILSESVEAKVTTGSVDSSSTSFKPTSDCFGEITNSEIFGRQVRYLNSLENRLKELQEEAKEIRPIVTDLKNRISVFMRGPLSESRGEAVEKVNLKKDKVRYTLKKSKRTVSSISKKELPKSLTRYMIEVEKISEEEAKNKVERMMEYFKSICKKVEKTNLTRKNL